jgi:hypothetical protein
VHTLCHIPDLIRKYSKISIFNCQAIEELNNFIKQQISSNNNNYDTTKPCVRYFSRNNLLLDSQRVIKKKRQWQAYHLSGFQPDSPVLRCAVRLADETSNRTIQCPVLAQMINQSCILITKISKHSN